MAESTATAMAPPSRSHRGRKRCRRGIVAVSSWLVTCACKPGIYTSAFSPGHQHQMHRQRQQQGVSEHHRSWSHVIAEHKLAHINAPHIGEKAMNRRLERFRRPYSLARPLYSSSKSSSRGRGLDGTTRKIRGDLDFELHPSITSISAEEWDSFLAPDGSSSPFMEHAWLRCLEESGCASPSTGWVPQHLSVRIGGVPSVYVPLYIKGHSLGEFIFDNGWAEAAYQNGIQYYPKLLVGVPFTPATGGRILLHPDIRCNWPREEIAELRVVVGKFLRQIAISNNLSSVHLNFITDEEATDISGPLPEPEKAGAGASATTSPKESKEERNARLQNKVQDMIDLLTYRDEDDYLRRTSMQYHWTNRNAKRMGRPYESFDDYLNAFKSKRRITIRRERKRVVDDENIRIDAVVGTDILKCDGLVEQMYTLYISTVNKMVFGKQYLTLDFFQMLAESNFCRNLCFMCVRPRDSGETLVAEDVFAGTFNIIKDGVFYGRYWGCLAGREIKNLHFETCYWKAIEHCIENGLRKMEPGAGGGDYKWARGFDPALIHSAHYICHPGLRRAVNQFLEYETESNQFTSEFLLANSVVGSEVSKPNISKMKRVQAHARVDAGKDKNKDKDSFEPSDVIDVDAKVK